jgi:uncharacterized protein (TIGR00288 family)
MVALARLATTLIIMDEERIGLFIDYENLAIGARDDLGIPFDFKPVADALAERGRVVVRRAYADWTAFEADRRMLSENHVEMIEIPQRKGLVRKNAADIKMAVDAVELAFERGYVTTFVICTGDSDFTPLVHKLRELNKRVIGVGLKASTSKLLPAACDEFLFYENLDGVEAAQRRPKSRREAKPIDEPVEQPAEEPSDEPVAAGSDGDLDALAVFLAQTVAGLERSSGGAVRSSMLKRAVLRKDPTFSEGDYGFRAFGELLRHFADTGVLQLSPGGAQGDPVVSFAESGRDAEAFGLLRDVVADIESNDGTAMLSGLKNQLRKRRPAFNERRLGYSGFLQFVRAAHARGLVNLEWDDEAGDYELTLPSA